MWIGFGVSVLSGVTIGRGAVITAGSIIAKDVPPCAIWIGNDVYRMRFSDTVCNNLKTVDFAKTDLLRVRNSKVAALHVCEANVEKIVRMVRNMCE